MLKTKIMAGAITNLTDARYFAAREVEWLGFDFSAGSDTYISPAQMLAIKAWVDGVKFVGAFNLESAAHIRSAVAELGLDAVQLSMTAPESTFLELAGVAPLIREIVPGYYQTDDDLSDLLVTGPTSLDYVLLNLEKNGFTWSDLLAGLPFSLAALQDLCTRFPVLLALHFVPQEVTEILRILPVKGLHLQGGSEEKVGLKSFDDLDGILDLLEEG